MTSSRLTSPFFAELLKVLLLNCTIVWSVTVLTLLLDEASAPVTWGGS